MICTVCRDEHELASVGGFLIDAPADEVARRVVELNTMSPFFRFARVRKLLDRVRITDPGRISRALDWVDAALRDGVRRVPCPVCRAYTFHQGEPIRDVV